MLVNDYQSMLHDILEEWSSDKWLGTGVEDGSNNWQWKVCFSLYLVSVIADKNYSVQVDSSTNIYIYVLVYRVQ
jgi:hypothetical protein